MTLNKDTYISKHGEDAWIELCKKKGSSLDTLITKYGLEEGTNRYNLLKKKRSIAASLEGYISRYGVEEGTQKFNLLKEQRSFEKTLEGYISRYGVEEGTTKYLEKNSKLSVGLDSLKSRGYSDEEIILIKEKHSNNSAYTLDNQIKKYGVEAGTVRHENWKKKSRLRSHRTVEYWLSKGFNKETSLSIVAEIQNTSSLDKFISRYGVEEGTSRYIETNIKKTSAWSKSTNSISKIETFFFLKLSGIIEIDSIKGRNKRILHGSKIFYCDYIDVMQNKIIEIYGWFWHMKPTHFSYNSVNPVMKITASEVWDKDRVRIDTLKELGYQTLVLWEDDIYKDFDGQLNIAKNFLEGAL